MHCGAVSARLLHAPLAAREPESRGVGRFVMASFPLHPPVGCEQRRYLQNTQKTQAKLPDLSFFRSASPSFSLFKSAALSASFLLPLLPFQVAGGMTKDCRSVGTAGLLLPLEAIRRLRKERPVGLSGSRGSEEMGNASTRSLVGGDEAVLWCCL